MLWFIFACSEQKIGVFNTPPDIQVLSPTEEDSFFTGFEVLIEASVSDPNDEPSMLSVEWSWDNGALCLDSVPDVEGAVDCVLSMPSEDTVVTLEVRDPVGAVDVQEIVLRLAEEAIPEVEILSPLSSQTHYVDRLISFSAQISDADSDINDLSVYWESSVEGVLDVDTTIDSTGLINDYAYLTEGEHAISLWVEDERGNKSKEISVIEVGPPNRPPDCAVDTEDGSSIFGEPVIFSGIASDLDIPAHLLEVQWRSSIDGILDISAPSSDGQVLLSVPQLSVGQHIITMEVRDELDELCSDTVVHNRLSDNTEPVIDSVNISPFPAYSNSMLNCSLSATDVDGDSLTISYVWSNLSTGLSLGNNSTVQLSAATVLPGHQLECAVVVDDGNGGNVQSTGVITVENSVPILSGLSISPSTPQVGDIASCLLQASDIDDDVLSVNYSWQNVGTGDILGSNDSLQLMLGSVVRGDLVRCTVEVADLFGGVVSDFVQETIANTLPVISSLTISPSTVYADTDVEAVVLVSDPDGDSVSLSYEWSVNGSMIQQSSISILDASLFTRGDVITLEVIPSDPVGTGVSESYGPFTIQNTPPTAPVVSIDPQEPLTEFDDLQCIIDVDSQDADGDSVTYSIIWTVDGVLYTGSTLSTVETGDTIVYSETLGNEDWTCSVLPNDGFDTGSTGTDSVTVISCADYRDANSSFLYGTLVDARDAQTYRTIAIGNDVWMADNFNYGNMITTGNYAAENGVVEKHCLDNNPALCNEFGGFYGRSEAISWVNHTTAEGVQGICPVGWHIPTEGEFLDLFSHVFAQYELVDICEPGGLGGDLVGFAAKLAGSQSWGAFGGATTTAKFWTSTHSHADYSYNVSLQNTGATLASSIQTGANPWANTMSIRCVED
jgi:uncharacterized protein (TIGR02145 family)